MSRTLDNNELLLYHGCTPHPLPSRLHDVPSPSQLFSPIAATDNMVLMCQAVPEPAAEEHSIASADQACDGSLPSTTRSGKAKKLQHQKGKGSGGSRPLLQPPVLCSVLPCLQKLELYITGGHITSCWHECACINMLALLWSNYYAYITRHNVMRLLQSGLNFEPLAKVVV